MGRAVAPGSAGHQRRCVGMAGGRVVARRHNVNQCGVQRGAGGGDRVRGCGSVAADVGVGEPGRRRDAGRADARGCGDGCGAVSVYAESAVCGVLAKYAGADAADAAEWCGVCGCRAGGVPGAADSGRRGVSAGEAGRGVCGVLRAGAADFPGAA